MAKSRQQQATDIALDYFAQRFNCAEAVLLGLVEAFGLDQTSVPRIATAFGGGMAGCGHVCGALSGAMMAVGLKHGRQTPDDLEAKSLVYTKVRELFAAFEAEFGTIQCIDLIHIDLRTPEGIQKANELDLHNNLCPEFVAFAARETARLLSGD